MRISHFMETGDLIASAIAIGECEEWIPKRRSKFAKRLCIIQWRRWNEFIWNNTHNCNRIAFCQTRVP